MWHECCELCGLMPPRLVGWGRGIAWGLQVLKKQIGEGSIGKVHLGKWRETDVAVKILNSLSSIGVAEAEESEISMDGAKESVGSGSHESREAERSAPLATLEREVRPAPLLHSRLALHLLCAAPGAEEDPPRCICCWPQQPLPLTGVSCLVAQVNIMAALRHPNIVLFMGVCLDPPCVVSEWCARGSLFDVLSKARKNPALAPQLDWTRRLNMALDAAKVGPCMLHHFTLVRCRSHPACLKCPRNDCSSLAMRRAHVSVAVVLGCVPGRRGRYLHRQVKAAPCAPRNNCSKQMHKPSQILPMPATA